MKESSIGSHSIKEYIEEIATSVRNDFNPNGVVTKAAWYSVTTQNGLRVCELIEFKDYKRLSDPVWMQVDNKQFLNMIGSLEAYMI